MAERGYTDCKLLGPVGSGEGHVSRPSCTRDRMFEAEDVIPPPPTTVIGSLSVYVNKLCRNGNNLSLRILLK